MAIAVVEPTFVSIFSNVTSAIVGIVEDALSVRFVGLVVHSVRLGILKKEETIFSVIYTIKQNIFSTEVLQFYSTLGVIAF